MEEIKMKTKKMNLIAVLLSGVLFGLSSVAIAKAIEESKSSPKLVNGTAPPVPQVRVTKGTAPALPQLRMAEGTAPALPQLRMVEGTAPALPQVVSQLKVA